jgi:hypothetical protein
MPDPREPVTGNVQTASAPADRGAALALLDRARQNGLTHRAGSPPYRLEVTFSAGGSAAYTGSGQLTETWLSGHQWVWTATLGSYSGTRILGFGSATGEKFPGAVPMHVHVLRNAIFWAIRPNAQSQIRTASVQLAGQPATCILLSGMVAPAEHTRLWEESEYCIDNGSGRLEVESIAPGTYSFYTYGKNITFHGQLVPDHIATYSDGALVLDAEVNLIDPGTVEESNLRPTSQMVAAGPVAEVMQWSRFAMDTPTAAVSGLAKPVIVHASINGEGNVIEEELCSASDPALVQTALDLVRNNKFGAGGQRQAYINVRFVPTR